MTTAQEKMLLVPGQGWFSRLMRGFARRQARRRTYLDIRELSPHLQRDMGFLDSNDAFDRYK
ncbi:MAG: hypothetical protein EOQ40_22265 [Mesorhizobium sp.]|uniref:hypothetical protein n=1 Tax=Mesorhizobium sp. TaxID=1871066 RepID=UPI000FE9B82F|nr:hypothetical protein [Mesorhizobium sp.]RWB19009.1 MAG: hypothetical protein EOQ40_22265 [Mesorhizobium sp.]